MLPYKLEKALASPNKLYTYKEVVELVAWALLPIEARNNHNIEDFKKKYPDVFDHKIIEADRIISYA